MNRIKIAGRVPPSHGGSRQFNPDTAYQPLKSLHISHTEGAGITGPEPLPKGGKKGAKSLVVPFWLGRHGFP